MDESPFDIPQPWLSGADVCMSSSLLPCLGNAWSYDADYDNAAPPRSSHPDETFSSGCASKSADMEGASALPPASLAYQTLSVASAQGTYVRGLHPSLTPSFLESLTGRPNIAQRHPSRHVNFNSYFCSANIGLAGRKDLQTSAGSFSNQLKPHHPHHPAYPFICKNIAAKKEFKQVVGLCGSANGASATVANEAIPRPNFGSVEGHLPMKTKSSHPQLERDFYGESYDLFDQLAHDVRALSEGSIPLANDRWRDGASAATALNTIDAYSDGNETDGSDALSSTSSSSDFQAVESRPLQNFAYAQMHTSVQRPRLAGRFALYAPYYNCDLEPYRKEQLSHTQIPLSQSERFHSQVNLKKQKQRRRERVVKVQRTSVDHSNPEVVPPSLQLWEFLLHFLELRKHKTAIFWTDREQGTFHISEPEHVAGEWGKYRDVPAMNYDKMSRALRYYYDRHILDKIGGRMMYKFTADVMRQVKLIREEEAEKQRSLKRKRKSKKICKPFRQE